MSRARRFGKLFAALALVMGVAGLVSIWWWLPDAPRDGWRVPSGHHVLGFLSDGKTFVTARRSHPQVGPIHLWDAETGRPSVTHFTNDDVLGSRLRLAGGDLIQVEERPAGSNAEQQEYTLRLIDAWTGNTVARFLCRAAPEGGCRWDVSPDGRTVALVTFDEKEQPRLECYDVATGALLHVAPGYGGGEFVFAPDGRRLLAIKEPRPAQSGPLSATVFDVRTGEEVATLATAHPVWRLTLSFSPDGELLVDSYGVCWDLAAKKQKWHISVNRYLVVSPYQFTSDGAGVIAVTYTGIPNGTWQLDYHNAQDGQENVERATTLSGASTFFVSRAYAVGTRGRLICIEAGLGPAPQRPSAFDAIMSWLRQALKIRPVQSFPPAEPLCLLVELETGREIARLSGRYAQVSPDGRFAITQTWDGKYQLWDIPPGRSPWSLCFWGGLWTAAVALICLRRAVNVARCRCGRVSQPNHE